MIVLPQACADDCPPKKGEALRECTVKPATKTCNLLPNELNSDVLRFTSHVPTCIATIQVVAGCANQKPVFKQLATT